MAVSDWRTEINEFIEWLDAANRAAETMRVRRVQLQQLAEMFPFHSPWEMTTGQLAKVLANKSWAAETRSSMRSAITVFYRWGVTTKRCVENPAELLPKIRVPAGKPKPTPEEVLAIALRRASDRDRLILLLGALAGLRRAEISMAHTDDIHDGSLVVLGKGSKVRIVPLHPVILEEISLLARGYLFPGKVGGHISAAAVGMICKRLLGEEWTAHTLRHRFATRAYAVERDLFAVQQLLGHSRAETTARYTQLPPEALNRAVMGAGPPTAA